MESWVAARISDFAGRRLSPSLRLPRKESFSAAPLASGLYLSAWQGCRPFRFSRQRKRFAHYFNYWTTWVTDAELPWMLESPTKVTVIPVEPSGNAEVVSVALPFFSCTVPKTVFPALNVTGPVGFAVGDEIVAINMTDL